MSENTLRKKNANNAVDAVDSGNAPSMKTSGNKSKNSRCEKCKWASIQELLQINNELDKLLQQYRLALLEADRRNVAMERSGLSVQKRIH